MLYAYVVGARDLIATLDEQTDYLGRVYCREPKLFFNVPAIIDHVANAKGPSLDANAMMLVLDYLVSEGRC